MNYSEYLKPDFISRLKPLDLQARLVVEGYLAGLHKSPYHGFSVEFAEYRPYIAGESIRHMDWKKYAKSDRLVVREYEDSTNLKSYLLLDSSASMAYASGNLISKFRYSILLAASLAYLLIHQRDAVGIGLLGSGSDEFMIPRASKGHLFEILSLLHNAKARDRAPMAASLHGLAEKIGRRGLVILFSDLMEEPEPFLNGIKHLRYLGHELIVFHLLDPMEIYFDFGNTATFEDMETGQRLSLDPPKIRKEYLNNVGNHILLLQKECLEQQIDYHQIITDQAFDKALTAFLQKRSRLRYA